MSERRATYTPNDRTGSQAPTEAPTGPTEAPPGYGIHHESGGYYRVELPDGSTLEGPSNGKWQGRDGALMAAWDDYEHTEE